MDGLLISNMSLAQLFPCDFIDVFYCVGNEDRYLLCDVCDGAYHAYCLRPQMASVPKNGWKCKR
jgi:hypothetical protein